MNRSIHPSGGPDAYVQYLRYLERRAPGEDPIEQYAGAYMDYLQAPLQVGLALGRGREGTRRGMEILTLSDLLFVVPGSPVFLGGLGCVGVVLVACVAFDG